MAPVQWEALQQTPVFEDMVSTLLSRLHPGAERIDGSGGDGGREVQLRTPERLELFQLKSFTGRVTPRSPNRRRQVEESLRTAAALQPDQWSLVVPIDHNPEELRWFDGLRAQYNFPLVWHGRGWLDDQMAAFPDLPRYYLEGASHEVVALLRELSAEEAALTGGVVDAVARLNRLRARLNDLDPQYRFELTPGPAAAARAAFPNAVMHREEPDEQGPVTISLIPRYRDAARDRPIQITTKLVFPNTELGRQAADQFRAFVDYGDPATIDSEYVQDIKVEAPGGLGGDLGPGMLRVGPPASGDLLLDGRMRVLDEADDQVASLPVRFTRGHGGERGAVIAGQDATGLLQISARFDETARQVMFEATVRPAAGHMPAALLPTLRFAHALRSPYRFTASIGNDDLWLVPHPLPDLELVPIEYLRLIEDLARIQAETNTPFVVPDEMDAEDIANVARTIRLLDGEPVPIPATAITTVVGPKAAQPLFGHTADPGLLAVVAPQCRGEVMGEQIPLGTCTIAVQGTWRAEQASDGDDAGQTGTLVRIVPLDARAVMRRGAFTPTEQQPSTADGR